MWFTDWVKWLFKAGNKEEETSKTTANKTVTKKLWDETVNIKPDESFMDSAAKWVEMLWGLVATAWSWSFWDAEDIDEELNWLKYNNKIVWEDGKKTYVNMLYTLDNLKKKKDLTSDDLDYMMYLDKELKNYSVPESYKDAFLDATSRKNAENSTAPRRGVNTDMILWKLNDSLSVSKSAYWISDEQETDRIRTITEKEYENELKDEDFNKFLDNAKKDAANKMVKSWYVAERNPWGRASTIDEVLWDLEAGLNDRSPANTLEAYKILYRYLKSEDAPHIRPAVLEATNKLVDVTSYIFNSHKTETEALAEYIKLYGNPFTIDLSKIPADQMTQFEQDILNASLLARPGDLFNDRYTENTIGPDGYSIASQLTRQIEIRNAIENWDDLESIWHAIEYNSSVLQWYMSAWFWNIYALGSVAWDLLNNTWIIWDIIDKKDISYDDYRSYLYWFQNSTFLTMKQRHQWDWSPSYLWSDLNETILTYWSTIDDIADAYLETKIFDLSVKAATLKNINSVISKWSKIVEATETAANTAWKVVVTPSKNIVTTWEKIKWLVNSQSMFSRVWNWIKNYINDWWSQKKAIIQASWSEWWLSKWSIVRLSWENMVRWLAEETITSALMQGLTPYDYEQTDLAMDIWWALLSWLTRALWFNNALWILKLQSNSSVWVSWWLRDVQKLSNSEVEKILNKLSTIEIEELWKSIKDSMWFIWEQTQKISRDTAKSKAQKLSEGARTKINDTIKKLTDAADEKLLRDFSNSIDPDINKLVKKKRVRWADGKYTTQLTWNWDIKNKNFARKVNKARTKLYWWTSLDDTSTVAKMSKKIAAIKNQVWKNVQKKAKKKWLSRAATLEMYKQELKRTLKKYGLDRSKALNKWAKETFFGIGPIDEVNTLGWMWRRLAIYVNNFILMKKASKTDLIRWLSILWKETRDCFIDRISRTHDNWVNWDKYTREELIAAIKEFWELYDEKIFPDWNLSRRTSRGTWIGAKKQWTYLAEWTYTDAVKANPELWFMWEKLFREIVEDKASLTLEQMETKLMNYRRTEAFNGYGWGKRSKWQHIYWIDTIEKEWFWRKVFNDTYEEKMVFWQEWKIYLKINEEDGVTVIAGYEKKRWNTPEPFDRSWTIECTYKKQITDTVDGHSEYFVYDSKDVHIATIRTDADVDFSRLWKKPTAKLLFPKPRRLTMKLLWDLEWNSVEFEVMKNPSDATKIYPTDIDLTLKDDIVVTSESYTTNWRKYKRESTLWQWNWLSRFIAKWETSYAAFQKLIPGYTDRVPEAYFNKVIKMEWLSPVDKQNLLMAIMVNKWIVITNNGVSVKTGRNVFRRPAYKYQVPIFDDKGKIIRIQDKNVKWDAETFMSDHREWTILLTDPDGNVNAYYYILSEESWVYRLYKDMNTKGYAWNLIVWEKDLRAYVLDWNKKIWAKNVEFIDNIDLNWARKILWERFDDVWNVVVKVPNNDEAFRTIYKKLYGAEMSEAEYHRLRSTPNMTPERYLNMKIQEFKSSRFWRYIPIRKWNWEDVAQQIWAAQYQIGMAKVFVNMFPNTALTDAEIMWAVRRLIDERMSSWGKTQFKFSKSEREIANIMYDKWKKTFSDSELISIYWYSMYWKEPEKMENSKILRLRNRRNNILLALYKDNKILDLSDWEKEMLINWAKRKWLTDLTEEELINDILQHPETYKGILQALSKSIEEAEQLTNTSKEMAELNQINKRLQAIEPDVVNSRKKKKTSNNTQKIKKEISDYQKSEVDSLLEQAHQEIEDAANVWDEQAMNAAYSKRSELEEYNSRYEEEQSYKNTVGKGWYTEDQFDFLAKERMGGTDTNLIREAPLSQSEVNARIKDITDRMPGLRVVLVDPVTWKIDFRWFTKEEQLQYAEKLKTSTQAVMDWRANAAHVRELHAIVVNPRLALSNTLWHEWFHEAVYLMQDSKWTPAKIENLYFNTFKKHREDIESFATERWYDIEYKDIRESSVAEYQKAITEEWLAERFWDYVNNRYNETLWLDSDVALFFRDLWERMQLLFSDTNAMELFEDIYEWRVDYWDVTIGLKSTDVPTTKFSLLSDDAKEFFNNYDPDNSNIGFWDVFNFNTIDVLRTQFRLSWKDLKVWTSNGLVWRWAFAAEIKTTLQDWTRTSFNELYESINKKAAVTAADNLTDYIYGREFIWDFYDLTENVLLELKTKWHIVREGAWFKVEMKTKGFYPMSQLVKKNKTFVFSIWMWESELFRIDNTTDFIESYIKRLPEDISWKDWYQWILREIMKRLNDSWSRNSKDLSRTLFYHKISKEIQSSRTMDTLFDTLQTELTPKVLEDMTIVLENWIRKWCKQIIIPEYEDLPKEVKQVMHEAYFIYLFNQYIPHGDKTTDLVAQKLFSRKDELNIRLIKYIDKNAPKGVSYYIYNKKWSLPTLNFIIDLEDWVPRYIGWHLPKNFKQIFEQAWLSNIEINNAEFNRITVWNKSLLNTSAQEYQKAISEMDVNDKGKEYVSVGKSPRTILEEAKPKEFEQIIHYQKPAIINGEKVIFGKDAPEAALRKAYEKGLYYPVTLVSEWRHKDNLSYMNKIHKKYNISIQNASPKIKEKIAQLKEKPKKNIAVRRKTLREYEKLKWRKSILEAQIRQKDLTLKAFQQWQIYQAANRIKDALDSNSAAYKAIQDVDDSTIINVIEDIDTPSWGLNEVLETTISTQPPFWKLANIWDLELENPAMKDWVDNLKNYQDVNKMSWLYDAEIRKIESSGIAADDFVIYPVREWDLCNEITNDMLKQKWFAVWAENSKVLNDWKTTFEEMFIYEREWSNIAYFRNPDYGEPKVGQTSSNFKGKAEEKIQPSSDSIADFIAEMEKNEVKNTDIPAWRDCSYNLLKKAKESGFMDVYKDDIDDAMSYIEYEIARSESITPEMRDRARIQWKINTIENNIREWRLWDNAADDARQRIEESDIWQDRRGSELDQFQAADEYDTLRDQKDIDLKRKYQWWYAVENKKLRKLMKKEEAIQPVKGSFIASISEMNDLNKRLMVAEGYLDSIKNRLSKTNWKARTEDLLKDKNRIEHLIEKTKNEIEAVDDMKYITEWEEAAIWIFNDSSLVCKL